MLKGVRKNITTKHTLKDTHHIFHEEFSLIPVSLVVEYRTHKYPIKHTPILHNSVHSYSVSSVSQPLIWKSWSRKRCQARPAIFSALQWHESERCRQTHQNSDNQHIQTTSWPKPLTWHQSSPWQWRMSPVLSSSFCDHIGIVLAEWRGATGRADGTETSSITPAAQPRA